jgi:hypothetical protein
LLEALNDDEEEQVVGTGQQEALEELQVRVAQQEALEGASSELAEDVSGQP